jgi:cytochrome c556
MSRPMMTPPPNRSPYASAGKIAVSVIVVVLLVVFTVSRFTRPPQPVATATGGGNGSVLVGVDPRSGLTTTFVNIGKSAQPEAPPAAGPGAAAPGAAGTPVASAAPSAPGAGAVAGPGSDPSYTGASHSDDLVLARQLLMEGNETAMGPIDRAVGGEDIPLVALRASAYTIYTYLSIGPHMFPSQTKPVTAADGTVTPSTAAVAAIWDDFDAFYNQFTDAANLAYTMSETADIATFRADAKMLRVDCDACHAKNMHVFDPKTGK